MQVSLTALLITLSSSLLWGCFDGLRKHLTNQINIWLVLFCTNLGISITLFIYMHFFGELQLNQGYLKPLLISSVLNATSYIVLIQAIKVSPISNSLPFLAFTSLFTALSSYILLGEKLNLAQIIGICILVIGALLVNYVHNKDSNLVTIFKKIFLDFKSERGSQLMILVSLLWAISAPYDKIAIGLSEPVSHALMQSIMISIIYLLIGLIYKKLDIRIIQSQHLIALVSSALTASTALILQFYAYTIMKIPIFESLKRAIALVTAFVISIIFFKEKITKLKLIGTSLTIIGASTIILN